MSTPVAVTADARGDINDARDWYETQRAGRGDTFLVELQNHFAVIGQNPQQYGRVNRITRAAPLPYSKYIVYYRVAADQVIVTAVQHAAGDPKKWQRRK